MIPKSHIVSHLNKEVSVKLIGFTNSFLKTAKVQPDVSFKRYSVVDAANSFDISLNDTFTLQFCRHSKEFKF